MEILRLHPWQDLSSIHIMRRPTIGVFDSGFGGLTVLKALLQLIPGADYAYFGDTARLPYGSKSVQTVARYAVEAAHYLEAQGAQMLVIACNTATALALDRIRAAAHVPVIGVVEPGAEAARAATKNHKIVVIGTEATVSSHAYRKALEARGLQAREKACPLLVPLVEEAWLDEEITREVLHRYLDPLIATGIDTLVLGCTHYPLLAGLIEEVAGPGIRLVDSAKNCAVAVRQTLIERGIKSTKRTRGRLDVALTDGSNSFLPTAERVLRLEIDSVETRIVQGVTLLEPA